VISKSFENKPGDRRKMRLRLRRLEDVENSLKYLEMKSLRQKEN
jgi:hypothetical protein